MMLYDSLNHVINVFSP